MGSKDRHGEQVRVLPLRTRLGRDLEVGRGAGGASGHVEGDAAAAERAGGAGHQHRHRTADVELMAVVGQPVGAGAFEEPIGRRRRSAREVPGRGRSRRNTDGTGQHDGVAAAARGEHVELEVVEVPAAEVHAAIGLQSESDLHRGVVVGPLRDVEIHRGPRRVDQIDVSRVLPRHLTVHLDRGLVVLAGFNRQPTLEIQAHAHLAGTVDGGGAQVVVDVRLIRAVESGRAEVIAPAVCAGVGRAGVAGVPLRDAALPIVLGGELRVGPPFIGRAVEGVGVDLRQHADAELVRAARRITHAAREVVRGRDEVIHDRGRGLSGDRRLPDVATEGIHAQGLGGASVHAVLDLRRADEVVAQRSDRGGHRVRAGLVLGVGQRRVRDVHHRSVHAEHEESVVHVTDVGHAVLSERIDPPGAVVAGSGGGIGVVAAEDLRVGRV